MRVALIAALTARKGWAQLAAEQGYSDQAHLGRDVRRIAGLPPAAIRRHLSRIEHDDAGSADR